MSVTHSKVVTVAEEQSLEYEVARSQWNANHVISSLNGVWIGAEGIRAPPTTKPATLVELGISVAWEFSDNTDDTVVANFRIPYRMDKDISPTLLLSWSSPATSKVCKWQVEILWTAQDESVAGSAQSTLTTTSTSSSTANGLTITSITLPTPDTPDLCLHLRIKRLGADPQDTLENVAHLSGICMQFTSDKIGETP